MNIYKQIQVWVLIGVYMTELLAPAMPFVDYFLHKNYIEKNLCINRNNPDAHCHGMCHVKKELFQIYKAENPFPEDKKQNLPTHEIKIYTDRLHTFYLGKENLLTASAFSHKEPVEYLNNYHFLTLKSFFHPPPVL